MVFLSLLLSSAPTVNVRVDPAHVIRSFDPQIAFGGAIDGHEKGDIDRIFSPASVKAMLSAGLGRVSYRLRTELAGEAWHWNPSGSWSDPKRQQGYWTSSDSSGPEILKSYGYRLPRRGNTIDQAGNDGYSRITDGDPNTFWKSNPYLDTARSGRFRYLPPQWVVVDFGRKTALDKVCIEWGAPHADNFTLQAWRGSDDAEQSQGAWEDLSPRQEGLGSRQWISFRRRSTRYLRLLLERSFDGKRAHGDWRDTAGVSIRELYAGTTLGGSFHDAVHHGRGASKQTAVCVSSTDPWHRASDIDPRVEQPGFDLFFKSGITRGLPAMMPIPALYDTPENVAAEVRWLRKKGYPVSGFEIGEEPDGQSAWPEHFAYLYAKMAEEIHREYPKIPIGGPSFQTIEDDFRLAPDTNGPWLPRFFGKLKSMGHRQNFNFGTFEWYPFDDVTVDPERQLLTTVRQMRQQLKRLQRLGFSDVPWDITEYGYSAFAAEAEVDLPGAVFNIDSALTALELGCRTSYLYGYEPNEVINEIDNAWGNNMLFLQGEGKVTPLPTYYASRLLTQTACQSTGAHELLRCSSDSDAVGAYAIRRPDGRTATLLTNRTKRPQRVALKGLGSPFEVWLYGREQYTWISAKDDGHPGKNQPPVRSRMQGNTLTLPPYGIGVLRTEGI